MALEIERRFLIKNDDWKKFITEKIFIEQGYLSQSLDNWIIISEAIQTILRREGYSNPYESLKELTRKNSSITKENLHKFIDSLDVSEKIKNELKVITPSNYTGI